MRQPQRGDVREPALAGRWYPGPARALAGAVRGYLAGSRAPADEELDVAAVIAPHAGYVYSGPTAGVAWRAVADANKRRPIKRIVMVGPAHRVAFRGIAVGDYAAFRVPTGDVPVDREALAELERKGLATWVPEAHVEEHCLEIELPFMIEALAPQSLLPPVAPVAPVAPVSPVSIVPLLMGHVSHAAATDALRAVLRDGDMLVMSSDLSHYEPYTNARAHDLGTLERIVALDGTRLGGDDACGHRGIGAGLEIARERGWRAAVLDYRSSGDTAGDKDAVVGYGAVALGCRRPGHGGMGEA